MKNKRHYSKLNLFLRSLLFSVVLMTTCTLYCFVCLLAAPLPLRFRYRITRVWIGGMVTMIRLICHIDYRIEGLKNLQGIKNGIVMSKHSSAWETFFLCSYFDQVAMLVKKELLWVPFFGWGLALLKPIGINRSKTKSAMQQLTQQGTAALKAGRWLVIFPEGTRIPYGQVGKYRAGGARLAIASGYPIIPMAHNAGRLWPRRQFIKIPGTVTVAFGEPIYSEGKTAEEITHQTQTWIEAKIKEFDHS